VERLKALRFFTRTHKFDGLAGDGFEGQRRDGAGVRIEFDECDAGKPDFLRKRLGYVNRRLAVNKPLYVLFYYFRWISGYDAIFFFQYFSMFFVTTEFPMSLIRTCQHPRSIASEIRAYRYIACRIQSYVSPKLFVNATGSYASMLLFSPCA
jgi:hypothetical protein